MKQTRNFSIVRIAALGPKEDKQGGLIPTSPERAKDTDFITLPEAVEGTNCSNCLFVRKVKGKKYSQCVHPKVRMPVNNRNCCKYWDAYGTKRHFKFNRGE